MTEEIFQDAEWSWLAPHLERGALVLAGPTLDLAEVARALAEDDSARVADWLREGRLVKATAEHAARYGATPAKPFRVAIVQPFVIAQEIAAH